MWGQYKYSTFSAGNYGLYEKNSSITDSLCRRDKINNKARSTKKRDLCSLGSFMALSIVFSDENLRCQSYYIVNKDFELVRTTSVK